MSRWRDGAIGRWPEGPNGTWLARGRPLLGLFNHPNKLGDDVIDLVGEFGCRRRGDIPAVLTELNPNQCFACLRFGVRKLGHERGWILSLPPRLGDIRADRSRGSSYLVDHRMALFNRPRLRQMEDLHGRAHRSAVNIQLPTTPDRFAHGSQSYLPRNDSSHSFHRAIGPSGSPVGRSADSHPTSHHPHSQPAGALR